MGFKDRLKLTELAMKPGTREIERDRFELKPDPDGVVRQACWFCSDQVAFSPKGADGDAAVVLIEIFGTHEHLHGLAHADCARRSQGALQR